MVSTQSGVIRLGLPTIGTQTHTYKHTHTTTSTFDTNCARMDGLMNLSLASQASCGGRHPGHLTAGCIWSCLLWTCPGKGWTLIFCVCVCRSFLPLLSLWVPPYPTYNSPVRRWRCPLYSQLGSATGSVPLGWHLRVAVGLVSFWCRHDWYWRGFCVPFRFFLRFVIVVRSVFIFSFYRLLYFVWVSLLG